MGYNIEVVFTCLISQTVQSFNLVLLHEYFDNRVEFRASNWLGRECIHYQLIYGLIIQVRQCIHIQLVLGPRYQVVKQGRQHECVIELLNPLHNLITEMHLQIVILDCIEFAQEIVNVVLVFIACLIQLRCSLLWYALVNCCKEWHNYRVALFSCVLILIQWHQTLSLFYW